MASIDDIVTVTITADTTNPTRAGFGTPLILTYHTRFTDAYRSYGSLTEMASDGFTSVDDAYRMAAAVFSQNPRPLTVIVGRLASAPAYERELTITSAVEDEYVRCKVMAPETGVVTQIEHLIDVSETTTTLVAAAVEPDIEDVAGVDSVAAGAVITITPTTAGRQVFVYDLENCTVKDDTADGGYDTALTALQPINNDWYWVLINTGSKVNIDDVAAWVAADNKKIFIANVSDSAELGASGLIGNGLLSYSSNSRVATLYSAYPHQFSAAAWVGVAASRQAGTYAAALKSLNGVTADGLTSTEEGYLEGDNINHYQSVRGVPITLNGVLSDGTYIDDRHGIDALLAAIQEAVLTVLVNSDKVPFTDAGLDVVKYNILAAMRPFEGTVDSPGLLVPDTSAVVMPTAASVSAADKAARRLTGVRFTADLSGAIQGTTLSGSLSV